MSASEPLAVAAPQLRQRAWPVLTGLAAFVAGLLMLTASWYVQKQGGAAIDQGRALQVELTRAKALGLAAHPAGATTLDAPLYYTHLSDVEALVRVAEEKAVRLGTLNFRTEPVDKLPVVLRIVEVRIEEDYPHLKAFIAELLSRLPHAYLDEVRIDRVGEAASKVQATMKLTMVYRGEPVQLIQPKATR